MNAVAVAVGIGLFLLIVWFYVLAFRTMRELKQLKAEWAEYCETLKAALSKIDAELEKNIRSGGIIGRALRGDGELGHE